VVRIEKTITAVKTPAGLTLEVVQYLGLVKDTLHLVVSLCMSTSQVNSNLTKEVPNDY
jgi:hypothetical protein